MSQTILIGFNEEGEEVYALNLNTYVGTQVICKNTHQEAIELMKLLPQIDLIVTKARVADDRTACLVNAYLEKVKRKIPMIVCNNENALEGKVQILPKGWELKALIQAAAKILGVTATDMAAQVVPEYFPVSIQYFKCMDKTFCEIFVRREGKKNEFIFQTQFQTNDEVRSSLVENLIKMGVDELYIKKNHRLKFISSVTTQIVSKLNNKDMTVEERIQTTDATMELVREQIGLDVDGFSEDTVELAAASIKSLAQTVSDEPRLKNLLAGMMSNKSGYLYKHSQLITFLAFHAIENAKWGTDEQKKKLSFISFFHDIVLSKDSMAQISSQKELDAKGKEFTEKEIEIIHKHAQMAAFLIRDYPRAPIGADTIIKQHHGSRNGLGFAEHFGTSISPLAIVFIVCEAFADILINQGLEDLNVKQELNKLHCRFTSDRYSDVIDTFALLKFN